MLGGNFRKSGAESYGISGTFSALAFVWAWLSPTKSTAAPSAQRDFGMWGQYMPQVGGPGPWGSLELILRRNFLYPIDDQDFDGSLLSFELESELILEGGEEGSAR